MKNIFLYALAVATLFSMSCNKTNNNNVVYEPQPAYAIYGIENINFINSEQTTGQLNLSVTYLDSTQQTVTLSLSNLPAGIAVDSSWQASGIPTFNATITFYDTTQNGATPGTYPMTLTAIGAVSGTKVFPFSLKVIAPPPCIAGLLGKYSDCTTGCAIGTYTDSVYADPSVTNKIWFTNFNNMGIKVYGNFNCTSDFIVIPSQTVGGITIAGSGDGSAGASRSMFIDITITYSTSSTPCSVELQ